MNHVSPRVRVFIIALCSVVTLTASFTSSAQGIPARCLEEFSGTGAIPGTASCFRTALSFRRTLGNFFCNGPDAELFCNGSAPAQAMDVEKNPPECLAEGNPINVATGNKYQIESDTVLKSKFNEH